VGGSGRSKNLKICRKLSWNFQRGGKVLEKIPSEGGMDIFWNYTIHQEIEVNKKVIYMYQTLKSSKYFRSGAIGLNASPD